MISEFLELSNIFSVYAVWPDPSIKIWSFAPAVQLVSYNGEYSIETINKGKFETHKIHTIEELKSKLTKFNITL